MADRNTSGSKGRGDKYVRLFIYVSCEADNCILTRVIHSQPSAMMQDYLSSTATISERIAMGGGSSGSHAMHKDDGETSKSEGNKAVKDFDAKWDKAARG